MLTIRSISLGGFKSFRKESTLDLSGESGLYLLEGRNKLEPNLGANGAGKSTVWDALCWAWFGKTMRGLRAGNVAHWELGGGVNVSVEFARDGREYKLVRTWGPIALTLATDGGEPKTTTQEEVEAAVGVDLTTFTHSIVIGQFTTHFLDLSPTERLAVFSEALRLDDWLKAADRARVAAKEHRGALEDHLRTIAALDGQVKGLGEALKAAERARDEWQDDRARRLASALEALNGSREQLRQVTEAGSKARAKVDELNAARESARKVLEKASDKQGEAKRALAVVEVECEQALRVVKRATKNIDDFSALGPTCSVCKQPIDEDHAKHELRALKDAKAKAVLEQSGLIVKRDKAKQAVDEGEESLKKASARYTTLDIDLTEASRELASASSKWKTTKARMESEEASKDRISAESNPHFEAVKSAETKIDKAKKQRADAKSEADNQSRLVAEAEFWVSGFKDLRLWLITRTLEQFEVEVNNSLRQLGMDGWLVKFEVESETKSGSISRGFQVVVTSPGTDDGVPWEAWSGGESQRLRIAAAAGLANLIQSARGVKCDLEVWDEPTAHLSGEGIEHLLDFLHERARSEDRRLWLVDHRSLDYGGFVEQILVVKDANGSRFKAKADA